MFLFIIFQKFHLFLLGRDIVNMIYLHPWKLTCRPKKDYFNRKYIFQPPFFKGYVSFQGGKALVYVAQVSFFHPTNSSKRNFNLPEPEVSTSLRCSRTSWAWLSAPRKINGWNLRITPLFLTKKKHLNQTIKQLQVQALLNLRGGGGVMSTLLRWLTARRFAVRRRSHPSKLPPFFRMAVLRMMSFGSSWGGF